jgi:protein-S-isoprenylcysteine O-methyltransferase Ste14
MGVVRAAFLVLAAVEITLVVLVTRTTHLGWPPMRIAGMCLLLLVIAWVSTARYQCRSFSVTPQARQLVTNGLYARFRNPIYLASPILLIGLSLVFAQRWPVLRLIVIVPLQIVRARREASVLRAAFGGEYDRYRARTWL